MKVILNLAVAIAVWCAPLSAWADTTKLLAMIDNQCAADGIDQDACACHREVFRTQILARASDPEVSQLAAMLHAMETIDRQKMMQTIQNSAPAAMEEAGQLIVSSAIDLEACDDEAEEAQREAEMVMVLPEGNDSRSRFVRQCAAENGKVKICECVADSLLESIGPMELGVIVDLRAADAKGNEGMKSFAKERGMTTEDAKKALTKMAGRIAGAMMSIDPVACARAEE